MLLGIRPRGTLSDYMDGMQVVAEDTKASTKRWNVNCIAQPDPTQGGHEFLDVGTPPMSSAPTSAVLTKRRVRGGAD